MVRAIESLQRRFHFIFPFLFSINVIRQDFYLQNHGCQQFYYSHRCLVIGDEILIKTAYKLDRVKWLKCLA